LYIINEEEQTSFKIVSFRIEESEGKKFLAFYSPCFLYSPSVVNCNRITKEVPNDFNFTAFCLDYYNCKETHNIMYLHRLDSLILDHCK